LPVELLHTATADFRANLHHARSHSLLIEYYLKRGLSAEQVRQAIRNASTAPVRSIHVVLPSQTAA
jgi:hypothetical protein